MTGRRGHPPGGFTLLELIVVIAVIATVLVLTLPRLHLPGATNDLDAAARQIVVAHRHLKIQALRFQRRHMLNIDLDAQRTWITDAAMDAEKLTAAAREGYRLPGTVRIRRLRTADDREWVSGTLSIPYFPDGHCFMVDIEVRNDDDRAVSICLEPFLPEARVTRLGA